MSTISIDRYFTIKFPFKYGRNKSRKIVFLKIVIVWIISISICSAMFILGLKNPLYVYDPTSKICAITDGNFKFFASVFAFFIPLFIVVITYSFTMLSLKRLMDKKKSFLMGDGLPRSRTYSLGEIASRQQRTSRLLTYSFVVMKDDINMKQVTTDSKAEAKEFQDKAIQLSTIPTNNLLTRYGDNARSHLPTSSSFEAKYGRKISRDASGKFKLISLQMFFNVNPV